MHSNFSYKLAATFGFVDVIFEGRKALIKLNYKLLSGKLKIIQFNYYLKHIVIDEVSDDSNFHSYVLEFFLICNIFACLKLHRTHDR